MNDLHIIGRSSIVFCFQIMLAAGSCLSLTGCTHREELPAEIREQLLQSDVESAEVPFSEDAALIAEVKAVAAGLVSDQDWVQMDELPWRYAEVQYYGGVRVGFSILTVSRSDIAEFKQLKVVREDVIDSDFNGNPIPPRRILYEAFERPNGELTSFRFTVSVDEKSELELEGRVIFQQLEFSRREGDGKPTRHKIEWPKGVWGPLGLQAILKRAPMQPGQVYSAQVFLPQRFPQLTEIIPIKLEAKKMDLTPLANGQVKELLLIEAAIGKTESGLVSRIWTDQAGVIQKSMTVTDVPILQMRVEVETAQRLADQAKFAAACSRQFTLTSNNQPFPDRISVKLRVYSLDVDPFRSFLVTRRQQLRSTSASSSEITLGADAAGQPIQLNDQPPDESCLSSSAMIPSQHPLIAQLAGELLGEQSDASVAQKAELLRIGLNRIWKLTPRSAEINSTLESARNRTGGDIEGAFLLAALLRQQKIPARLIGGLLIDVASAKASFHVWNQAWLEDGWHELDTTVAQPVQAQHIAMTATSGDGENPYHLWMPMLDMIRDISDISLLAKPQE